MNQINNENIQLLADALAKQVRAIAARGWCPATGGNFSARVDENSCLVTASGVDKAAITADGLIHMQLDGKALSPGKPSAEAQLHLALYRLDASIGAVLHGHSVANTVLSRLGEDALIVEGYEMQKATRDVHSHETRLAVPMFDNDQDMQALAREVERRRAELPGIYAFLVRGHGIYAWGADLAEAWRHLEGWEFLLECEMYRRILEARL